MKKEKEVLRKDILQKRMSFSKDEVNKKSLVIMETITDMEQYRNSCVIMSYVDFRNEVVTSGFIKKSLMDGKRIVVPVMVNSGEKNRRILASEIFSLENDLEVGNFGILQPKKECLRISEPNEIELIILPGVAFDLNKNRIGYGAGYYDRFLQLVKPCCIKIGVCFEVQMVDSVPVEGHDIPLDIIVTEDRIIP